MAGIGDPATRVPVGSCLAVIPARGGSKGIIRKNLQTVGGVPLVVRSVHAALAASSVDRVVVSTDDDEIAALVRVAGAEVRRRPDDLAGDRASSESALLDVVDALEAAEGHAPDLLVLLQCTSPLTTPEDIDGVVGLLRDCGADTVFTAARSHRFLWRVDEAGRAAPVNHDARFRLPRQQAEPEWVETGAIYAVRVPELRRAGSRFPGTSRIYEVPAERSLEIDDPLDLALLRTVAASTPGGTLPDPLGGIVLDFDGVLTDDRVWTDVEGRESVACSRGDGLGIERLRRAGVPMLVLSKEQNPVVAARCAKLRLECRQGIDDKLPALRAWARENEFDLSSLVYVGNDVNDLACLQAVGCGAVPHDAHPDARAVAHLILDAPGGRGAVRALADLVLHETATGA